MWKKIFLLFLLLFVPYATATPVMAEDVATEDGYHIEGTGTGDNNIGHIGDIGETAGNEDNEDNEDIEEGLCGNAIEEENDAGDTDTTETGDTTGPVSSGDEPGEQDTPGAQSDSGDVAKKSVSIPGVKGLSWKRDNGSITIKFTKVSGMVHEVQIKKGNGAYKTSTKTKKNYAKITGLSCGTTYTFRVRVVSGNNTGEWVTKTITTTLNRPSVKTTSGVGCVKLSWNKITGATGYRIYVNGKYKKRVSSKTTTYKVSGLTGEVKYKFKVQAVKKFSNGKYYTRMSKAVYAVPKCRTYLYQITSNCTACWRKSGNYAAVMSEGTYITGYYSAKYKGKICINLGGGTATIPIKCAKKRSAKILASSGLNQCFGSICGYAACGPTALWTILKYEAGYKGTKDNLITYAENHNIKGMYNLRSCYAVKAGCTGDALNTLAYKVTSGKCKMENFYTHNACSVLVSKIDSGRRCIVNVKYNGATRNIITSQGYAQHFVTVCGYEKIKGVLYFYYVDPLDANCIRRVKGSTLNKSIGKIVNEPKAIICRK